MRSVCRVLGVQTGEDFHSPLHSSSLEARQRRAGLPRWRAVEHELSVPASELAVVLIDTWAHHPFQSQNVFLETSAPLINELNDWMLSVGGHVIWSNPFSAQPPSLPQQTPYVRRRKLSHEAATSTRISHDGGFAGTPDSQTHTLAASYHGLTAADLRIHPALRVRASHMHLTNGTEDLWRLGVRTVLLAGGSLSECLLGRPLGARSMWASGFRVYALRGVTWSGGDPTLPSRFFADDWEATGMYLRFFEKFFDGVVDAAALVASGANASTAPRSACVSSPEPVPRFCAVPPNKTSKWSDESQSV